MLSEDAAKGIFREFDRSDRSVGEIWGLIQDRHDDPDDDLYLRFSSGLAPHMDSANRLIRVAPIGAILANLDRARSAEIELIESELNRFKPHVDADPRNRGLLDNCEEELHELFDEAADTQLRTGFGGFLHGEMSWLEVRLTTNIKLSGLASGIPTFCTTSSSRHREAEIFASRTGAADRARDILGLAPFDNTYRDSVVALGAMAFDATDLDGEPAITRPSVADLVDGKRFKGTFGELERETDVWGRAVDLETISSERPHRGGREVVVAASQPESLFIAFLGYLRLPRRDVYTDPACDDGFEALCLRGRSREDFMKILCE